LMWGFLVPCATPTTDHTARSISTGAVDDLRHSTPQTLRPSRPSSILPANTVSRWPAVGGRLCGFGAGVTPEANACGVPYCRGPLPQYGQGSGVFASAVPIPSHAERYWGVFGAGVACSPLLCRSRKPLRALARPTWWSIFDSAWSVLVVNIRFPPMIRPPLQGPLFLSDLLFLSAFAFVDSRLQLARPLSIPSLLAAGPRAGRRHRNGRFGDRYSIAGCEPARRP
jgi:hypothetical protein